MARAQIPLPPLLFHDMRSAMAMLLQWHEGKDKLEYRPAIPFLERNGNMVCYAVPIVAALAHHGLRKNVKRMNENPRQSWLTLLLAGGGLFGFIDHLWNGELTLIGSNLLSDLALGAVITVGILCFWEILVLRDKVTTKKPLASD